MKKLYLLILVFIGICLPVKAELSIVATTGQIADTVRNITGDLAKVEALMGPGVDPHLYKASQSDVRKLSDSDIIFYNGLHLEAKLGDVFKQMAKSKMVVAVSQSITKDQLLADEEYEDAFDPHVWFDLSLWIEAVGTIRDALVDKDPSNKDTYESNAKMYINELNALLEFSSNRVQEVSQSQRVLVTAHDAFRYFGRAYDFEVLGLQGISTESEAGTKDVIELANLIVERQIKAIFVESSIPERNIRAVQEAVQSRGWNVSVGGELFSDALGDEGAEEGTFIGMYRHNVNTVVDALK